MQNSQNKRLKSKIRYCILWIFAAFGIWFANCDKDFRTTILEKYLNGTISFIEKLKNGGLPEKTDEKAAIAAYWDDVLQEYCLAGELVLADGQGADNLPAADGNKTDNLTKDSNRQNLTLETEAQEAVAAMAGCHSYMQEKLSDYDYLKSNFYVIDSTTSVSREELDGESLANMDLTIDTQDTNYKILIYHTHGTESFADSEPGNTDDTVIGLGNYLTELLEETYGVSVYHDTTAYDMKEGTLDRSTAYDYAREGVEKILDEYPSIEVVIDIHRDGVAEGTYLVTEVNGKPTAQVMFLNGVSRLNKNGDISYLENPYKTENLAFSLQMYLTAKANYDSYVRKIFVKGYRYNLDLRPRSLLVEVGSQTNTVEEAKNAMEPLAAILYKVLSGN